MGRFNLLDEPWISVIIDESGKTKEVSLKKLFQESHLFLDLAGDTKIQDFAIMRILLAVLHTVFSRFNADGEEYGYFQLDERFKPLEDINEEDLDNYIEDLYETWQNLWENKKFPKIICEYLEKWNDRFYLFDGMYPFMQVRKEHVSNVINIEKSKKSKKDTGMTMCRTINRLISESKHKIAIFSPKIDIDKNKLKYSEFVRWLITFQQYSESGEKNVFSKGDTSCGWLMEIGGYYFKSDNLFKTLLINFMIIHHIEQYNKRIQKPCWEYDIEEILNFYVKKNTLNFRIDNLASLYTSWSRAIYNEIDFECFETTDQFLWCIKLNNIKNHGKQLEVMTAWENKKNMPIKLDYSKSIWRSFGVVTSYENLSVFNNRNIIEPAIVHWINKISRVMKEKNEKLNIILCSVGVDYRLDASKSITNEIFDYLNIDNYVFIDTQNNGWIIRINEVIEKTKKIIKKGYESYILDICEIRNIYQNSDTDKRRYINKKTEELYFKIDLSFRRWISSIKYDDFKEQKTSEWLAKLYSIVKDEAENIIKNGTMRDYIGIENEGSNINIVTIFNKFMYFLNNELIYKEDKSGGD
ncbi:MAG: type I-E CRISPR-associated protein Cse1/CasA [Erysipelotrichaceae bacterium]|nr:type I-E CRISPR-associated protein Cse1/CasA [Erysipelotrichaceae bacterium]